MQHLAQQSTIDELERLLRSRIPMKIMHEGDFVHAAVMMILSEGPEGLSMLFIKRPESDIDAFFRAHGVSGGQDEGGG